MGIFSWIENVVKKVVEEVKETTEKIFSKDSKTSQSTTTTTSTSTSVSTSTGGSVGGVSGTRSAGGGGGITIKSGGGGSSAYFKPEIIKIPDAEKYASYSSGAHYSTGTQLIMAEIPKEERIAEPPSTFQRLFGFLTSPFSTVVTEKYTSPTYGVARVETSSPTPTGKGTIIYGPMSLIPAEELRKSYPHAYYSQEIQASKFQTQQKAQEIYSTRFESEFNKALAETGLAGMIVHKGTGYEYTGPAEKFGEAKVAFEKAQQIAHTRASEFAIETATKEFKRQAGEIQLEFGKQMKQELIRVKPYDIAYQSGVAFATGGLAGSTFTSLSYAAHPAVTKGLTVAGIAAGGFFGYKEASRISREYSLTKTKFGEELARKELTWNIAGVAATTASFGAGWVVGSKITASNILKSQRVVLERGTFMAREIDKQTLVGKGISKQVVQYDVKFPLFGKKTITEYHIIEYPFITQVGKGTRGIGSIVGTRTEAVGGYNVLFRTEKGFKVFGATQDIGNILGARSIRFGDLALTKFYAEKGLGMAYTARGTTAPGITYIGKTTVRVYRIGGIFGGKPYFVKEFTFQPTTYETFVSTSAKKFGIFGAKEQGGFMRELKKGFFEIEKTSRGATAKFKAPMKVAYQEATGLGPLGYEKYYSQKIGFIIEQPKGTATKMIIWKGKIPTAKPFEFAKMTMPKPTMAKLTTTAPKFASASARFTTRAFATQMLTTKAVPITPVVTPTVPSLRAPSITPAATVGLGMRTITAQKISVSPTSFEIPKKRFSLTQREQLRIVPVTIQQPSTRSLTRQIITPHFKIAQKELTITEPTSAFKFTPFTPTISPPIRPIVPPTFLSPSFWLPRGGLLPSGFQKSVLRKPSYRYQPSLAAIVLKIKAPRVPRIAVAGFTIRPIVKRRKK
ncbi:MAG: hypothetical protein QW051_00280 [Candidatus Aenigmatarchaeota archaeon]